MIARPLRVNYFFSSQGSIATKNIPGICEPRCRKTTGLSFGSQFHYKTTVVDDFFYFPIQAKVRGIFKKKLFFLTKPLWNKDDRKYIFFFFSRPSRHSWRGWRCRRCRRCRWRGSQAVKHPDSTTSRRWLKSFPGPCWD